MEPMTALAIGSLAASAAGAGTSYFGGKSAADQKAAAIKRWQQRRAELLEALGKDQWQQGRERQASLTDYLDSVSGVMGSEAAPAPVTSDFAADGATDGMDETQRATFAQAMAPRAQVADTSLAAGQATLDRSRLSEALAALGYSTSLTPKVKATQHSRTKFRIDQDLAENDAQFQGFEPSNGAYNLQLLGSLLGTAGNAGMMVAGRMGSTPSGGAGYVPPGAAAPTPSWVPSGSLLPR